MAVKLEYPPKNSTHNFSSSNFQPGKSKVPLRLELSAEQYSNNAQTRANGGEELVKIILPQPTDGMNNSISHAYNQSPAKEEALIVKTFSGEGNQILRDISNFFSKQFEDAKTTFGGVDFGRIPADMSESTYSGSDKRGWNFTWDLVALSKAESNALVTIGNQLTSYSLPGASNTTDRAVAPPVWRIKVLSDNGQSTRKITRSLLGDPKLCVLTNCVLNRDTTSLFAPSGSNNFPTPLSMQLKLNFQEIEPVYGQDGRIRSRAEIRSGGSWSNID
tara:strand:- start:2295 stop:3119 length:825 start_codon:yes stop_codon:yes gene_type:complete